MGNGSRHKEPSCRIAGKAPSRRHIAALDFTPLIFFGQYFEPRELPEVRALHPEIQPGFGCDGQFYAQTAAW